DEEEEDEIRPARKRKAERIAEEEIEEEEPVYTAPAEPVKPVMKRVEVTQAIPAQKPAESAAFTTDSRTSQLFSNNNTSTANDSVFNRPSPAPQAQPRPTFETKPAPAASASSFISADKTQSISTKPRTSAAVPQESAPKPAPATRRGGNVYEFRPVISPIFGVDEKDANAYHYVPKTEVEPVVHKVESTKIISPIYGISQAAEPEPKPVEAERRPSTPEVVTNNSFFTPEAVPQEEEKSFPEFSLDDILSARDEEYSRQTIFNTEEVKAPDIDETVVIDSNRFAPYDQQTLDFDPKK
ncbi:MAG: hypothetical protein IJ225_04755, partial [Solobacterium sp.]|nr:hypothetical protein [Solobacterium sp.]